MITGWQGYDENTVQILYFEYKTYNNQVFKIKQGPNGLEKAIQKNDEALILQKMIHLKEYQEA